jgi:hypothetical protein
MNVSSRLTDQLKTMFESRAPWDEEGKYTLDRIGVSVSRIHFFVLNPDL